MALTLQPGNYVKFLRGTPSAWAALDEPNSDTLYFIAETNATKGKLYLGSKLISDGTVNIVSSLSDLSDVLIENSIPSNGLLVYDITSHSWKPQSLSTIFSLMVSPMVGATASTDGTAGLVPAPDAGEQNLYLRGDATWANPTATLNAVVNNLIGSDTGKSIRTIAAEEVAKLVANAPENFDTLKEIADWIEEHDTVLDVEEAESRLEAVETAVFGNGDDVDGLVSDVDTLETNLSSLTLTVTNIENTIKWQDMVEE